MKEVLVRHFFIHVTRADSRTALLVAAATAIAVDTWPVKLQYIPLSSCCVLSLFATKRAGAQCE